MSWIAVAVVGGGVLGGVISSHGAQQAAQTQAGAAQNATNAQLSMFNTLNEQQAPWRAAGQTALGDIARGFGIGDPNATGDVPFGYFNEPYKPFTVADFEANKPPGYEFQLQQGLGATTNAANAMGGLGGNSLKAINDYAQGFAQNAYQNAFENYNVGQINRMAQQTNIFNRLASIAGLGQTAGSNAATGASSFGSSIGNSMIGVGQALGSGIVGSANAWAGGINNAANGWLLSHFLQNNPGVGSGPV